MALCRLLKRLKRMAKKKTFENIISNLLGEPVCNLCHAFYDQYVEANVKFRSRAGMKEVIIRRQLGKCCKWCADLAGIYEYGDHPDDVFRRHDNCKCMVTYKDEGGYQDVWSKKEFESQKEARKAREIEIQKQKVNDRAKGLGANRNNNYTIPDHDPPELLYQLLDNEDRRTVLLKYEDTILKEPIENAIVITKEGKVYRCRGTIDGVYPDVDLGDELYGADVTHNHPIGSSNEYSFSDNDINLFEEYKLSTLRGVDELFEYELSRKVSYVDPEIYIYDMDDYSYRHNYVIFYARKYGHGYWRKKHKS